MHSLRRFAVGLGVVAGVAAALPALAQNKIGMLELKGKPAEKPSELSWLLGTGEPTLRELVDAQIGRAHV